MTRIEKMKKIIVHLSVQQALQLSLLYPPLEAQLKQRLRTLCEAREEKIWHLELWLQMLKENPSEQEKRLMKKAAASLKKAIKELNSQIEILQGVLV